MYFDSYLGLANEFQFLQVRNMCLFDIFNDVLQE